MIDFGLAELASDASIGGIPQLMFAGSHRLKRIQLEHFIESGSRESPFFRNRVACSHLEGTAQRNAGDRLSPMGGPVSSHTLGPSPNCDNDSRRFLPSTQIIYILITALLLEARCLHPPLG